MDVRGDFLVIGSGIAGLRAALSLATVGEVVILTKADPRESNTGYAQGGIAAALGPGLWAEGLLVVGLDVIGDCLTEVNVTSPTCFVEITQQTGFDVGAMFAQALLRASA